MDHINELAQVLFDRLFPKGTVRFLEHRDIIEKALRSVAAEREKEVEGLVGILNRAEGTMNLAAAFLDRGDEVSQHHARRLQIAAGAYLRQRQLLSTDKK